MTDGHSARILANLYTTFNSAVDLMQQWLAAYLPEGSLVIPLFLHASTRMASDALRSPAWHPGSFVFCHGMPRDDLALVAHAHAVLLPRYDVEPEPWDVGTLATNAGRLAPRSAWRCHPRAVCPALALETRALPRRADSANVI